MRKVYAVLTLIVTLTFVISPAFTDPFSGFRADQLPIAQVNPPIQPAGYAFAIWGVIYLGLIASAVFGLVKHTHNPVWSRARKPLIISLAVGTPWLAVANISAIWATVMIFVMAAGAISALLNAPKKNHWLFKIPVGIYAGWLTAASFVSLGSTAAGYGLITNALGWAYLGIAGALIVAIVIYRRSKSTAYALTIIWALTGIIMANGWDEATVSVTAATGILILLALMIQRRLTVAGSFFKVL